MFKVKAKLFWQFVSLGCAFGTQIFVILLLANYFSQAEAGQVAVFMLIIASGQIFSEGGVCNFLVHCKELTNNKITALKIFSLVTSIFFLVLVCCSGGMLYAYYGIHFQIGALFCAGGVIVVTSIASHSQALCLKRGHVSAIAFGEVAQKVVFSLVLLIVVFIENNYSLYVYLCAHLISHLLRLLFLELYARRAFFVRLVEPDFRAYKESLGFMANHFLGQGVNIFSSKIDEVLLTKFFSIEVLGGYFVVKQGVMQVYYAISLIYRRLYTHSVLSCQSDKSSDIMHFCSKILSRYILVSLIIFVVTGVLFWFFENYILQRYGQMTFSICISVSFFMLLKYMSANLQCYFMTILGRPLNELYWNFIQVVVVLAFTLLYSLYGLYSLKAYMNVLVSAYMVLLFMSMYYFRSITRLDRLSVLVLVFGLLFLLFEVKVSVGGI